VILAHTGIDVGTNVEGVYDKGGFGSWRHLSARFFGALLPLGPRSDDESWALAHLTDGERELWYRMSGPDRRHAVRVARDTMSLLGGEEDRRDVIAAALLHDVGKVEASLGTFARVAVTFSAIVFGRLRMLHWAGDETGSPVSRWRTRIGLYLTHDKLGAELLGRAGSQKLTVSWAEEHHLAPEKWTVDARIGTALKTADGD
jgi:HD domain